jgi:hypothetical protein
MSIKQFFFVLLLFPITVSAHVFTIVLDPGTQQDTTIAEETVTCIQMLQQALEDTFPQARFVLSRTSQEVIDPLQVASFSNRIKADLHISFNFFMEKEVAKNIRIYYCPTTIPHTMQKKSRELALTPATSAHKHHAQKSKILAQFFFTAAKNASPLPVFEPQQLPLKTLKTIIAPSFLLEVGVGKSKEWKAYFPQLFEGLKEVISNSIEDKF